MVVHGIQVAGDWALNPYRDHHAQGAGRTFRLLFLTSGTRNAVSSDIADYNAFVQDQAGGGHQAIQSFADQFAALASTAAVDARDNTATTQNAGHSGVPVYWLNGAKLADDYADLYDGGWDSNQWRDEDGQTAFAQRLVWTGSTSEGTADDDPLGGGSSNNVMVGQALTQGDELSGGVPSGRNNTYRLYALSPLITVVTPTTPAVSADGPDFSFTGLTNGVETHFRVRAELHSGGRIGGGGGTYVGGDWSASARATPSDATDYDADDDGLIEIANLAQLNAVRWDMRGRGEAAAGHELDYFAAFPVPLEGMGCPPVVGDTGGCRGYELAADLDFGTWDSSNHYWNGGEGWLPIGSLDNDDDRAVYGGVFDGNGRTIANLYVDRGSYNLAGLFDGIGYGGVVRDLGLPGADVTGNNNVGALSGLNSGTVLRSWSTGGVTAQGGVAGGLVGVNGNGDLIGESWSAATVAASDENAGGLVGDNRGTVRGSYAEGGVTATGEDSVGGLAGLNSEDGSILRSYATGQVTGEDSVGGLVGHNLGTVTTSYATGDPSGTGAVSGTGGVGGLVGLNEGTITASYAIGEPSSSGAHIGGLVGNVGASFQTTDITDSYWDTETSGQTTGIGESKTTAELKEPTGYTGIYSSWNPGSGDPWDFGTAQQYPALRSDLDGDGQATWQEFGLQRAPGPVTGLAASRDSSGDIAVAWGAPDSAGSGIFHSYEYRVSADAGATWNPGWTETNVAGHTFTPAADTGYTVEARAVNTATRGNRQVSNPGPVSRIEPPSAPLNLALAVFTGPGENVNGDRLEDDEGNRVYLGAIGVSWSAPADASGVTGYVVEYRTAAACSDTAHADRTACEAASETWTAAGQWMDAAWDAEDGLAAFIGASDVDDDLVEGTALEVDTAYDVRVAAVGVLGVGAWADDTATPITETRAPGTPRNILVRPAPGGLVVTWDRPLDPGNPPFEDYVVEVKPTDGWDCNNPATGQPWTGAEEDFPLWVAVHCVNHYERVVNGETLPAGFYPPESGWAQTHINLSGSQSIGPYDGPNTYSMRFLTDGVEYQVRMRAEGVNVEDPDNAGEYIALASDWSPVMTGTPGPRPPGVPQNLSVTPGDQSMAATWAAPEDPGDPALEGYVFQWRQAGATPPAAWESAVTLTAAYDVAMLTNGTEYEARVAGFHHHAMWTAPAGVTVTYVLAAPATGTACPADTAETGPTADCYVVIASESIGDYTEAATATPGAERTPGVPQNLQLLPGDQSIVALWEAPQDTGNPALDGYVVQWRQVTDPASDWTSFVTLGADGNDYELNAEDGIANDVEYQVRVAAFHKLPVTPTEDVRVVPVLAASDVPAPEAGQDPLPECPSDNQPTADCYVVVPAESIGPYTAIETAAPSPLPTILTVVAGDAPLNPGLTPGVGRITVTWDAPAEENRDPAHSGYIVQYRNLGATEWTDGPRIIYTADNPEPQNTDRSAVITGLAEGVYEVRVGTLLHDGAVLGSFTQPQRATVRVPGSPRNLVLVPGPGQLTAQWDAPEDRAENHAGYVVQYRAVGGTTVDGGGSHRLRGHGQ